MRVENINSTRENVPYINKTLTFSGIFAFAVAAYIAYPAVSHIVTTAIS